MYFLVKSMANKGERKLREERKEILDDMKTGTGHTSGRKTAKDHIEKMHRVLYG